MVLFQKNQRVEGYFDDGYYPAIIHNVNEDGTYVVHFDDGDVLEDMVDSELRSLQDKSNSLETNRDGAEEIKQSLSPPKQKNQLDVQVMLAKVEAFLLPRSFMEMECAKSNDETPSIRLKNLLHELSIGEHLRTIQFLYRDSEDDLKLEMNVRRSGRTGTQLEDHDAVTSSRISSKKLIESLTEGRCRAIPLCRMCFGTDSIETLKAVVDLANIYAVQGLWEQVSKHMGVASQKLLSVIKSQQALLHHGGASNSKIALAFEAASYVITVFKLLREHAVMHKGYVTKEFVEVVGSALETVVEQTSANAVASSNNRRKKSRENALASKARREVSIVESDIQGIPSTDDALYGCFPENDDDDFNDGLGAANSVYGEAKKSASTALSEELDQFFSGHSNGVPSPSKTNKTNDAPVHFTWGQLVYFFRHDSVMMKEWFKTMDNYFLPQNKSVLAIVFQMGDKQAKGICHPIELSQNLMSVPSAMKILAGTQIISDLNKMKIELPISINTETGDVVTIRQAEIDSLFNPSKKKVQNVKYELPIVWEEFLGNVIQQNCTDGANPLDMLRIQIWNLLGLCNVFSNHLNLAEENMRNALGRLEVLGLEMEVIAVDLYNAISQLMVVKHRKWHDEKKERCRVDAEKWLHSKEGKDVVRMEVRAIKMHYASSKGVHLSHKSAEDKATAVVLKLRTKHLMKEESDPTTKDLEAAYRYLIRAYEILEKTHGSNHANVASASLAVASVLNLICNFEESKEWLVRSIRILEKMNPLPVRAIAFAQAQLSNILIKLKHPKSAEKVLCAAVDFHVDNVMQMFSRESRLRGTPMGSTTISESGQSKEDIETALQLLRKLMNLHASAGGTWQAAECAEKMAEIADMAYGWDSQEAASMHKQAGERQAKVRDWGRACGNLKKCLDTYQVLFGEKDKRCAAVVAQLQKAQNKRDFDLKNDPKYGDDDDDDDEDGEVGDDEGSNNDISNDQGAAPLFLKAES